MNETSTIAARLLAVRRRIEMACIRVGRDPSEVELAAVSKFHPPAAIRDAYAAGQRTFGENYAQELASKAALLGDLPELRFRFIGGVQTNKAKMLVQTGCTIDSLATANAARTLAAQAVAPIEILLQVNVANEPQKRGVSPSDLPSLIAYARALPMLDVRGLMVIPPADNPSESRRCFRALRELARQHQLSTLSMGMSDDLEIAVEEGSTMVRVGTAIFGPRSSP